MKTPDTPGLTSWPTSVEQWRRTLGVRRPGAALLFLRGLRCRRIALGSFGLRRNRQRLAAQQLQRILQLRVLLRLLRHVVGRAGALALAVLRLALQMAPQARLAGHPVGRLGLQLWRQL